VAPKRAFVQLSNESSAGRRSRFFRRHHATSATARALSAGPMLRSMSTISNGYFT
jgi:hypothetical protein